MIMVASSEIGWQLSRSGLAIPGPIERACIFVHRPSAQRTRASAESSALFCRMLIHRFAWPFAIRRLRTRFTDFLHSADIHTWTTRSLNIRLCFTANLRVATWR
jgi:hypothetical protein